MREFVAIHYRLCKPVKIRVSDGIIAEIEHIELSTEEGLPWVAPGFVDLQINGYGGYDVNASSVNEDVIASLTRALWKEGVTTFFPTVVTNSDEVIQGILHIIATACEKFDLVGQCVGGIHLEGPFISPEDGPRGAHPREYVRSPDWTLFERWQRAAGRRIRIVTLSPEWPEAKDFIRRCRADGVLVSIGHTAAQPEQIREAVAAGARMSTHLGNGAHVVLPRHPNYIWEQLANDKLWASVIADGYHLPDSVLKVFMRVKREKLILVSDTVAFCGMEPGEYTSHIGGRVVLTREGKLHMAENPNLLAGSVQPLKGAVYFLVERGLCTLAKAWEMASVRPARLMGLPVEGGLAPGRPADFVLFTVNREGIEIMETIKRGKCVYSKAGGGKSVS